jgi:hypothetical protein
LINILAIKDKEIVQNLIRKYSILAHFLFKIIPDAQDVDWDEIWWCVNNYVKVETFNIRPFLEKFKGKTSKSDHLAEIFAQTKCDHELLQ